MKTFCFVFLFMVWLGGTMGMMDRCRSHEGDVARLVCIGIWPVGVSAVLVEDFLSEHPRGSTLRRVE